MGGHIGAQETIETTIGILLWITFNILRVECFSCYTTLSEAFGIVGEVEPRAHLIGDYNELLEQVQRNQKAWHHPYKEVLLRTNYFH